MPRTMFVLLALTLTACGTPEGFQEIALDELRDRIEGGWAGQMIGVSYGAPTEFRYQGRIIAEDELPAWSDERLRNAIHQDDLYVEMTFAKVLDEKGLDATTEDFGAMFRESRYALWHANLGARRALRRGVPAEQSGTPRYNAHANDIDFQIEADFIGLMCPGQPVSANELCWRVGRVMNYGDGIYGGMFVSGMYAAAFFESDVRKVVEAGWAALPPESPYARLIRDVLDWSAERPSEWQRVWRMIEDKWNRRDPCPAGALTPFNIDAKLNGAYIALGLLYGGGDFEKTLQVATRAGQDSDCNPSNAAGVLGVMTGYRRIPERWKSGIEAVADQKFDYTDYSFREIVESTFRRALAMTERNGGRQDGDHLLVKIQQPEPARLEVWDDYGEPVERIGVNDPRWTWKGSWTPPRRSSRPPEVRESAKAGDSGEVTFEGTGAILVGPYLPDGGKVEVYLNGALEATVDVASDEEHEKGDESVWHRFGLTPGRHELRVVVLGEPGPGSSGSRVVIKDLVVFR